MSNRDQYLITWLEGCPQKANTDSRMTWLEGCRQKTNTDSRMTWLEGCRQKTNTDSRMKYKREVYLMYWLTKIAYKTKINSQLTQHSVVYFACSKQKLGILIDMKDLYLSRTFSDILSPTHYPSIKILLGYVFLYWGRSEYPWWEIGTLSMRY